MKIKANIADLKDRLSEYLKRVEEGDEICVCKRNIPIARIGPVAEGGGELEGSRRRSLREAKGWLDDEDPFFEVLEGRRRSLPRDPFG